MPALSTLVGEHGCTRVCLRHLYGNYKSKFNGIQCKEGLEAAARAYTYPEWEECMTNLREINKGAYEYLIGMQKQSWARHCFKSETK